jgi:outer membrane protein assembly factor BamB
MHSSNTLLRRARFAIVALTGVTAVTAIAYSQARPAAPAPASTAVLLGEWPEWRGPMRDGISREKNLPEKWSLAGENLLWKAPYGSRSAPVVFQDRLYLFNTAGKDETVQERLVALDANNGKLLWEYRVNLYQSDVPVHRIAWSSPAVDPETGNVYINGGAGPLIGLSKDGKKLWERNLNEEQNLFTTHGGRTVTPIIDGNLVIVSAISSSWGSQAQRRQRFYGLDKRTGDIVWVSTPGDRPYDTIYSTPIIVDINGTRLLISGGADGGVYAMKPQTGENVWGYVMTKRGVNTVISMSGNNAIVTHSEENLDTSEMGMIAALDATAKGKLGPANLKWSVKGFQAGVSSPIVDGDRIYQLDNSANLVAFDVNTGNELWKLQLGTIQRAAPVFADGKLYVGTENGKFFILRPSQTKCEILSSVELPPSTTGLAQAGAPEVIYAAAAISKGRVFFASSDTVYAIGRKSNLPAPRMPDPLPKGEGAPAWVQVAPTEMILKPGQTVAMKIRLYDDKGRLLREEPNANVSFEGLKATYAGGNLTVAPDAAQQAGVIKATVGGVTGESRARVIPALPWSEDFTSYETGKAPPAWVGAIAGAYEVQDLEGNKVFAKKPNETLFKRMRLFFGPSDMSNYTVEADVRALERRRQLGDVGITAQTYSLVLFGNSQRLELWSWQPNTSRTKAVNFPWKKDTWYRLKVKVSNTADGKTLVQGKAWPTGESEPADWMLEYRDPIPNRSGSPGFFADAQFGAFFDNLKVTPNN